MSVLVQGLLVALAVIVFLGAVISAEAIAHPVLAKARKDLLGDSTPWHGHPMKAHPHLFRCDRHPRYPEYLEIYRREHTKVMRRIGWGAAVSCAFIFLSIR